jgi:putative ABC transport system permease protein
VYRTLLRVFPRSFRRRFETDLLDVFTDMYAAAPPPRARFWLRITWATLRHGLAERGVGPRGRQAASAPPGDSIMTTLIHDLSLALRTCRLQPAFTAAVVITMALGIGVTSSMFTVVNAVLLRPLPYAEPERVVMLFERDPQGSIAQVSLPAFDDWQAALTTVTPLALFGSQTANLTGAGEPDRLRAGFVSATFLEVLGVAPLLGRDFAAGEDRPGASGAILTYGTWARRFGADPRILGRSLTLNNQPFDVIGVLPRGFEFPFDEIEVLLPLAASPGAPRPARDQRALFAFGRLATSATREAAAAELKHVAEQAATAHPSTNAGWSADLVPFQSVTVRLVRQPLVLLMGAVSLVLLIACANVANLMLVRGAGRGREMAVRAAMGAGRGRLIRQLVTESVLLALAGGALGLLIGGAMTEGVLALAPPLPRADTIGPDRAVVVFTTVLSLCTGVLFGIVPAVRGSRVDPAAALQHGVRTTESGRGRLRQALIVAELALSLVLLVGAGLLGRSLVQMIRSDPGFDARHVLTMEYRLPRNKYPDARAQWAVHQRIVGSIGAVPGVDVAALASAVPFSGNGARLTIWRAEDAAPDPQLAPTATVLSTTADYFTAMGIPLVGGRTCGDQDGPDAPLVVLVNRVVADRMWPGSDPIGRRLNAEGIPAPAVVIGVTGDTLHASYRGGKGPQVYACLAQTAGLFATVVARTTGDPMASARAVQKAVWTVDPDQPVWKIRSLESLVASGVQRERLVTTLMAAAALLALLLAAVGIYSVVSQSVAQRTREVGVRIALGASRRTILGLILRETGTLVAVGLGLGLVGALAAARLIASQLENVGPRDPWTLAATSILLAATAVAAAVLPARRAASVDPVANLRAE